MATKAQDLEPTADLIVARNKRAAINPQTGKPVDKKVIYDIFRRLCHDGDPSKPWVHAARFSKNALAEADMIKRMTWATFIGDLGHTAGWFFKKVIFTDICNSIIPLSEKKAQEQALARKNKKGWRSQGSQMKNRNLRGPKDI